MSIGKIDLAQLPIQKCGKISGGVCECPLSIDHISFSTVGLLTSEEHGERIFVNLKHLKVKNR